MTHTEFLRYPLKQIYFYITRGCNLRCRHCWIAPKYQAPDTAAHESLSPEVFDLIIRQAKPLGLSAVKLTGGEPLLHPEIKKIFEIIKEHDLRINVETNGVLCTTEIAGLLASRKDTFISVSLDGVDADTHDLIRGVKGAFQDTLKGIQNLVEVGLAPQIIMTIMRANSHQMDEMVRLAKKLGAESVKFNIVQPTARGETLNKHGETLTISELVQIGKWVETKLVGQVNLRVVYSHPHAFRPLGHILGKNGDGCGLCGILGILGVLADGSYALCGIGETVPELVFGKAGDDHLKDIWTNASLLETMRQALPEKLEGICGRCVMKKLCIGSCIAQNYYRKKRLWAPFWYCEEAQAAGIFPASRMQP